MGGGLSGVRVLVIDDEEDSRLFLQVVLEDEGAEVGLAGSGDEGLQLARREPFDVVTLDLEMPGKNGIDVFCEMRDEPTLADLPVCIVTGHPEMRAVLYKRSVRAPEGFLAKPVEPEDLVASLRRILELRRRRAGTEASD
jgi:CheY-like chemotaxis protein